MGWVLGSVGGLMTITAAAPPRASSSRQAPNGGGSSSRRRRQKPSVAEVERAIGIGQQSERGNSSPSFMDLLASTPIGQAEGPVERKIREAAEWVVDRTDSSSSSGYQILLVVCLNFLPVWLLLFLVAFGVLKLPIDLPFMDALF